MEEMPDVAALVKTFMLIITGVIFTFLVIIVLLVVGWICHQRRNSRK